MSGQEPDYREVLPKKGLLFTESQPQLVLCKPKLLPLKSFTLQRLETMQADAKVKVQEQQKHEDLGKATNGGNETMVMGHDQANTAGVTESVSFE